jgi:mediator of RNA polymerase II transcription subunit 12, fungi type
MLAGSLWYRYHTAPDWAWRVWDNTFASLRLKPEIGMDIVTAQARARCYAEFLLHVDQHLPNGLDEHIARWLEGPGMAELIAIDSEAWDCVIFTLLHLVVNGALSATTVLQGLVYPLWKYALQTPDNAPAVSQSPEVYLRAAHDIFARLSWNSVCTADGIPPNNFIDLQRVQTRRQDIFGKPHMSLLISNMPTLVFLEHSHSISEELGKLSGQIRQAVCEVPEFRQGVYRDLNAVRTAFESSSKMDSLEEGLVEHMMDALRLILNVAKAGECTRMFTCMSHEMLLRRGYDRLIGLAGYVSLIESMETCRDSY